MIKKLLFLLVLLLTATTGAWAQEPVDGTIAWSLGNEASATVSASIMDAISSTGVTTGSGLTVSASKYFDTDMVKYRPATANAGNVEGVMIEYTIEAVDGYKFKPTGVDYAAVKDGTDNASYSWSYTIDGVESAITDVSMNDVLRNTGSNSGTAQLMHSESITADGCSVFTLRFYISNCGTTKNICIAKITISGSVSAAASGYTATMKDGVMDADKWTVKVGEGEAQDFPVERLDGGEKITVTYTGTKKVLGMKVEKKEAVDPAKAYLKWDADQKKFVATEIPESFTTVTSSTMTWEAGTYVVEGEVNITGTIELSGDVDLIIKDGAKLTAQGINGVTKNLSIYGQANQTGQLVVGNSGTDAISNITTLEVHSAEVTADSSGDYCGGFFNINTFNVYGGSVDAKCTGSNGLGIGLIENGSMNIYGGEVKAEGTGSGGIFYFHNDDKKPTVTVYGGKLWAGDANNKALYYINLTKDASYTSGKIETSADNSAWTEYTEAATPTTKYVRAGY